MNSFHTTDVMHFKKVTLLVHQIKRSLEFYVDILGLHIIEEDKQKVSLSADQKTVLIELIEDPHAKPMDLTQGLYHFALLLQSRVELAMVIKRLVQKRYPISGASDHGVSEAIYLDDPDGHGVEIYCDRIKVQWPIENGTLTMYTKSLDMVSLMNEIGKDHPYQLPQTMIIGHLHFHVPSLSDAKHFFSEILGFQVVMYYGHSALFIADGGYHHHLGLNTWQGDAPLCDNRQIGLKSYVLSVPRRDYLSLIKRLRDAHYELIQAGNTYYINDPLNQKLIFHVED